MTRWHVLHHYPSVKRRAAIEEVWEGKTPGGARVLLANPRWEWQFVKCLEPPGGVVDRTDEDGAHATRINERVAWVTVEWAVPRGER
jgi:hypothetical protein